MIAKQVHTFIVLSMIATAAALVGTSCGGSNGLGGCAEVGPCMKDADLQPGAGGAPFQGGGIVGHGGAQGGGGIALGGAGGGTVVQTCGEPGTPCCTGNACNEGGCCVSNICMAVGGSCVGLGGGVCSAGACGTCGGAGLPCCTTSAGASACTAPQTRCSSGTCAKCGVLGGPCCANPAGGTGLCNVAGAICSGDICVACGSPGNVCCPGNQCTSPGCCFNNACVAEGTACGSNGGACQAGRCAGCGSATQPCCASLCYDDLLCKNSVCAHCGNAGETCCPAGGPKPACQAGTACATSGSDNVCARCGSLGDVCCAGNACSEGCCSGGRCIAGSNCSPDAAVNTDAPIGTGGVKGSGGITGTGGVTGSGGVTSTGGCGALIDDMEAGTGRICSSRSGMWFTYIDTSTTSLISPTPGYAALPELMSTPRSSSYYAMHIKGTYSTYAGIGVWLNNTSFSTVPRTYNGSAYTGIRFWAKGSGSLIVVGQMPSTESITYGGTCSLGTGYCYGDSYAAGLLSSTTWSQFTVPFSSLKGGTVTTFDPSVIWSLEFQYYSSTSLAGAAFDLWIDDLTFY